MMIRSLSVPLMLLLLGCGRAPAKRVELLDPAADPGPYEEEPIPRLADGLAEMEKAIDPMVPDPNASQTEAIAEAKQALRQFIEAYEMQRDVRDAVTGALLQRSLEKSRERAAAAERLLLQANLKHVAEIFRQLSHTLPVFRLKREPAVARKAVSSPSSPTSLKASAPTVGSRYLYTTNPSEMKSGMKLMGAVFQVFKTGYEQCNRSVSRCRSKRKGEFVSSGSCGSGTMVSSLGFVCERRDGVRGRFPIALLGEKGGGMLATIVASESELPRGKGLRPLGILGYSP